MKKRYSHSRDEKLYDKYSMIIYDKNYIMFKINVSLLII